jgi:hypothetical protein
MIPCSGLRNVKPQKDRWELTSPRQIPDRFVEVILWGWQVESEQVVEPGPRR